MHFCCVVASILFIYLFFALVISKVDFMGVKEDGPKAARKAFLPMRKPASGSYSLRSLSLPPVYHSSTRTLRLVIESRPSTAVILSTIIILGVFQVGENRIIWTMCVLARARTQFGKAISYYFCLFWRADFFHEQLCAIHLIAWFPEGKKQFRKTGRKSQTFLSLFITLSFHCEISPKNIIRLISRNRIDLLCSKRPNGIVAT